MALGSEDEEYISYFTTEFIPLANVLNSILKEYITRLCIIHKTERER